MLCTALPFSKSETITRCFITRMTRITLKAVTYLTVHFQLSQIIACNEDIRQLFTYLFVNLCVNKQRYDFA